MTGDNSNPVLAVAKDKKTTEDSIINVNGVRIKIVPVSAALIEEISRKIKDPQVPVVFDKDADRSVSNPGDPQYLADLAEASSRRNRAAIDALALFGIDLIDGMPEDESWMKRLQYLVRLGHLDLSGFDMNDELDQEFLYKRYVLVSGDVLERVSRASGVNPADIEAAEESFRSSPVGNTD